VLSQAILHAEAARKIDYDIRVEVFVSHLRGRTAECEELALLLGAARSGVSGALVLRGEPGIGKTALIEEFVREAEGCRVLRTAGAESEQELAFAALQQLCSPVIEGREFLPAPQQAALGVAFGLSEGPPPDQLIVGLAVLGLLSEAAEAQPLLCAVDDAQWLDRASAEVLAFVARRVQAEGIALVFAMREPDKRFQGLPEILLGGLEPEDANALLASTLPWSLDSAVQERIVAETAGNPLALLELPRDPATTGPIGGLIFRPLVSVPNRVEVSFQNRIEELPHETRLLMLIAAAEPLGDSSLLWDAAELCQLSAQAGEAAEASGLLALGPRVTFRHPLVRSAVYTRANPDERRRVHDALADATDPRKDPDRRVWHRAQATVGHDEHVAEELHQSAGRAQARGGLAAAAAFRARAAILTHDRARRGERALNAAQTALAAGVPDEVPELLTLAEAASLDALGRARVELIRAQRAFAVSRGKGDPPALLSAARLLESLDVGLSRRTYLDALVAAIYAGRQRGIARDVASAALASPPAPEPSAPTDLLLDGLALMIVEGYTAGVPLLKEAIRRARSEGLEGEGLHWLFIVAANTTWDYESWRVLCDRQIAFARRTGTLNLLPFSLSLRMGAYLVGGDFTNASAIWDEITLVCEAMGVAPSAQRDAIFAAWSGGEEVAFEAMKSSTAKMLAGGEGLGLTVVEWATAARYNSMGRHQEALSAAESAYAHAEDLRGPEWIHELVEAAVRSGELERAERATEEITAMTEACGTDWALGVQAYCRALVSDGIEAEGRYKDAIERFERAQLGTLTGRAHLLYGEWLRRAKRRSDGRHELRVAYEMFQERGLESFAARAAREVAATGARVRTRAQASSDALTAQEAQVARLARDGHSNRMIGEQLFISPRTVEYHLRKVFAKLDVNTRTQLDAALAERKEPQPQAVAGRATGGDARPAA
jgi:DNA-binding CsgD family transcriptional regulator